MKPKPGPVWLLLFQLFQPNCSSVEKSSQTAWQITHIGTWARPTPPCSAFKWVYIWGHQRHPYHIAQQSL